MIPTGDVLRNMPKRVLIADDSEAMRTVLRNFIAEQPGVEVCALTTNGIDTIDAAMALQPDLLILDVQMPGLNGVEVASVLRKNLPSAKTVLFTIYGHTFTDSLASAVGANAVLAKTDGLPALAKTVQSLLGITADVVKEGPRKNDTRGQD
jgi:two-component system, NarL family, response regulator DesR